MTELFDTHAHLFMKQYESITPQDLIEEARINGVKGITSVALNMEEMVLSLELRQNSRDIYVAAGTHPHSAKDYDENFSSSIVKNAGNISLWGEIGLDYHYNFSPVETQKKVFRTQLELAREHSIPVMLHIRDAHEDALEIIRHHGAIPGSVLHCFTADAPMAKKFLDLGFYISFSGIVTFKTADDIRDALKIVPMEKLLLETDSPFLAPHPLRGKTCHPSHIQHTFNFVSDFLRTDPELLSEQIKLNSEKVMNSHFHGDEN
ncbi:MAG: TatD family hydrolase [Deltaproteobacteria bacterium]|nr:TatD family hydrolase [Deltaproteobacteria bacterium]